MVHYSHCCVHWHENDGVPLKEVDQLLRASGYFVYFASSTYEKDKNYPHQYEKLMSDNLNMWEYYFLSTSNRNLVQARRQRVPTRERKIQNPSFM